MEEYEPNPLCPLDLLLNILCIAYGYLHILFIGVSADRGILVMIFLIIQCIYPSYIKKGRFVKSRSIQTNLQS